MKALKMIFLGSGTAFTLGQDNYQSNVLLDIGTDTLLIDAGTDIRHALYQENRTHQDINHVYITHLHGDHCGGLDWLALATYFDSEYEGKPNLHISHLLEQDLWNKSLAAGLSTLANMPASLNTFFAVHPIGDHAGFVWQGIHFKLVQTVHFYNDHELMPSFGLLFTYNKTRIFYTSDTQSAPDQLLSFYEEADIIFHDCETATLKSGVHAHYSELVLLPPAIKQKMWLYHYNPGELPPAIKDGFLGFVTRGQTFVF